MKDGYLRKLNLQFNFLDYEALSDLRMVEYKGYQKMRS
jgi:hypothetical protein